ncbi:MAG: carbohydrate ABC transporter permease [Eubacteriales bacterium]|nr:carbohydrate ABC transporter permease [Christensenellaceae bacterium]MEA5065459.1 carbohydrate ABC transporter permease [Eubacteriales bacterium]
MKSILNRTLLIVLCVTITVPILLTALYSFESLSVIAEYAERIASPTVTGMLNIKLFPEFASIRQYKRILIDEVAYIRYYANSAIYGLSVALGQMVIGIFTAYALGCFQLKHRNLLFFLFVAVMILPFQVTMAPNYFVLDRMNLLDTPYAIILPGIFMPFCTFMYRQYFVGLPSELFDAAVMDGAHSMNILLRVVVPLSKPLICAGAVLSFVDAWNLVEQPLIYFKNGALYPLSLALMMDGGKATIFAKSTLFLLPPLLLLLYYYQDIIDGIQMCDLK